MKLKWYRKAATKGNIEAYYRIGRFYELGISVEQNLNDAVVWYFSSASSGYIPAIHKMIDLSISKKEYLKWILKGTELDDPFSHYLNALEYEKSEPYLALASFKKAINYNTVISNGILSIISLKENNLFFPIDKSIENIKIASDQGDSRCQIFLAWLYEFGLYVDQDLSKAFLLYKSGSENGDNFAIFNLSRFYRDGLTVTQDINQADNLISKLPDNFYSQVMEDLLIICEQYNSEKQLKIIYKIKASENDPQALFRMGELSNNLNSIQWYWLAAQQKHIKSMIALSRYYMDENNTDKNYIQAAVWLMMAENLSDSEEAHQLMKILEAKMNNNDKLQASILFTEMFYGDE